MGSISFEVQKRLETGDFGEEVEDGFFMADIGTPNEDPGPVIEVAPVSSIIPKTRAERLKFAGGMAAELMDYYMRPDVLNDIHILNPIRDGIPQCSKHPFVSGDAKKFGCIHGCGNRERDAGGNLPVARDGTLGDSWEWVRALVQLAVTRKDKRAGWATTPDLTRR